MRSNTSFVPARRTLRHADRRSRRRPALVASTFALTVLCTVGFAATAPVSQAGASAYTPHVALASFTTTTDPVATVTVAGTDDISTAVREALAAADETIAAATTVTTDIQASGLDVGVPDPSVDTSKLEEAVNRLEGAEKLPAPLVPDLAEDVTELVGVVGERVAGLRGSLDAALAVKAEQEAAAERARLEAEAKAAEEAAAAAEKAARSSAGPAPVYTGGGGPGMSPADAQAAARGMLANYGWGDDQFSCLVSLWNKESGWNYRASNPSSGAYGIPQALPGSKMSTAGADWQTNAVTQISWGLGYISGRYGSPCGAWGHSQSVGWY
jgi:hypothetical protein